MAGLFEISMEGGSIVKEKYIKAKIEIKMEKEAFDELTLSNKPLFINDDYEDGEIGIASDDEDGGW